MQEQGYFSHQTKMSDRRLLSDEKKITVKSSGSLNNGTAAHRAALERCDNRLREYRQVSIVNQAAVSEGQSMVIMDNNLLSAYFTCLFRAAMKQASFQALD